MRLVDAMCAEGPVVTDGAWGTQLQARGLTFGDSPDLWNLLYPHRVEEVARAYVKAGSQVILTNTFGANRIALERHGVAELTVEINRAGAAIARHSAHHLAAVFGTIGPTGARIADGEVSLEATLEAFREQAEALAAGGADGLVIETMTDLQEAVIALQAARETGLAVISCMSFGGLCKATPEEAARLFAQEGAAAIGANCGDGPDEMAAVCRALRGATRLPVWIKPNAGLPEIVEGCAIYGLGPRQFAQKAVELIDAGADFIGGCCGTGPEHIHALSYTLRARMASASSSCPCVKVAV